MPPRSKSVNTRYRHSVEFIQFLPPPLTDTKKPDMAGIMSDPSKPNHGREAHDKHHAKQRRARRDAMRGASAAKPYRKRPSIEREDTTTLYLYGLHTVSQAIKNDARTKTKLYASTNGLTRLEIEPELLHGLNVEECHPRELDKLVGSDAVHQGVVLETAALPAKPFADLKECGLVLVLDQVTDPHNVGAIMRSAVAMDAGAIITTSRYSPVESGVLAKSASGALDLIDHLEVRNLAECLETLHELGFTTIGLDSEESIPFEDVADQEKIALVLGSEGKGLRQKTRQTCKVLARLDMPGAIKSLNVSNAAALALYLSRGKLAK